MAKNKFRKCPSCGETKAFRGDQKTCGCRPQKPELTETNEVKNNQWVISLPKTRISTLEELIEYCKIDLSIWEVERFVANKWEMGFKNKQQDADSIPLFQIKAFLKKKVHVVNAKKELEALKELAKQASPTPPLFGVSFTPQHPSGHMLEINICDHHFGKLAWETETGHPNYDIHIASEVFERAFSALLDRTKSYSFDEIWFVVGNDLFNSDDVEGRTTKGTQVTTDARYHKTFSIVRNTMISAIERLRHLTKKVKVIMVSGNHDQLSVWHLGDSLECYFHKYKDVCIDNEPKYYKYHQFGKVMIMFTHGDKGSKKNFPLLMAADKPEMFGETKFREIHTGHTHHKKVDEQYGIITRTLSALCPPDDWHAENAFVGNLRSSEAFVFNKTEGLVGTAIYTDDDSKIEKATKVTLV